MISFLNSLSDSSNANDMFCSIVFLGLKKGPNVDNNLLAIILENFMLEIMRPISFDNGETIENITLKLNQLLEKINLKNF